MFLNGPKAGLWQFKGTFWYVAGYSGTAQLPKTRTFHGHSAKNGKGRFRGPIPNSLFSLDYWLRGLDLNQRPLGYEPNELPGCSTPHIQFSNTAHEGQ